MPLLSIKPLTERQEQIAKDKTVAIPSLTACPSYVKEQPGGNIVITLTIVI